MVLNNGWLIEARSATAGTYAKRWQGSGKTIASHGHYLLGGASYMQSPPQDDALTSGITDAASVRLTYLTKVVDAVCYSYDVVTANELSDSTFTCEGTSASNQPHDDSNSSQSNIDASLERKNQGCLDEGMNVTDFQAISPAQPENTMSPTVP